MTNTDTLIPVEDDHREYDSRYYDIEATVAQIDKINARAAAKGLEGGCTYQVETRLVRDDRGQEVQVEVLTFEYSPVKANGWTLVASVSWEGDSPIVNTVPGYEGPMVDRSTLDGHCDECGKSRVRNHVVVCEHPEHGRKVVGGQCVKDLLGHHLSAIFLPDVEPVERHSESRSSAGTVSYRTLDVVVAAIAATRTWGWVSASAADITSQVRTSQRTTDLVAWGPARLIIEAKRGKRVNHEYIAQVEQAAGIIGDPATAVQAQAILDWAQGLEQDSEFNANLAALAGSEFVDVFGRGRVGVLAYAPTGYARHLETQAAREAREAQWAQEKADREAAKAQVVSKALGQPKDKITFEATITGVRYVQSVYGTTTLVKFLTSTNQQAAWFASSTWISEDHIGLRVQVAGTVKDTSEFQGVLETRITRCKVVPAGPFEVTLVDEEQAWTLASCEGGMHYSDRKVTWSQDQQAPVTLTYCAKHAPKGA